jgi:hypothetical protein
MAVLEIAGFRVSALQVGFTQLAMGALALMVTPVVSVVLFLQRKVEMLQALLLAVEVAVVTRTPTKVAVLVGVAMVLLVSCTFITKKEVL